MYVLLNSIKISGVSQDILYFLKSDNIEYQGMSHCFLCIQLDAIYIACILIG